MSENREGVNTGAKKELTAQERLDRNFAIIVDLVIIALAVFLLVVDLTTLEFFDKMRIFGPGAFPTLIFIALILLCIWNIVEVMTGKGSSAKLSSHVSFLKMKKALRLFAAIVTTIFLMQFIGFTLAMMAFTFFEMTTLEEKKVKRPFVIVCSIVLPLCTFYLFEALGVNLPSLGWLLF